MLKRILLVQSLISSFKSAMKKKLGFGVWGVAFGAKERERERERCVEKDLLVQPLISSFKSATKKKLGFGVL